MLPRRIENFLNAGDAIVAETSTSGAEWTTFVQIRGLPKPGVPREARRYLNSTWSMWEYWDFEFRRIVLRTGWRDNEADYDLYTVDDARVVTVDETTFNTALSNWIADVTQLRHNTESPCPL
ncbi:hypothetical protein ACG04R_08650 [Roseateles sp. BYS78W]|uniref:Uncharacterized protein n=1 Tax=Pelomonas candidula TaxID=3299025 RepID=A0ABW7H9Z2_9BURK